MKCPEKTEFSIWIWLVNEDGARGFCIDSFIRIVTVYIDSVGLYISMQACVGECIRRVEQSVGNWVIGKVQVRYLEYWCHERECLVKISG